MRHLIAALTILCLSSAPLMAQRNYDSQHRYPTEGARRYGNSELSIRLTDHTPIIVKLDRVPFTRPSRLMRFGNVPPRRYRIKVFIDSPFGMTRRNLIYDNHFQVDPSVSYAIVINPNTGVAKVSSTLLEEKRNSKVYDESYYDYENSIDAYKDDRYNEDRDERSRRNDDDYYASSSRSKQTMQEADMNMLKSNVDNASFASEKIRVLKNSLKGYRYSTAQVKTMLSWLSFDSDKLSFAKWAYGNVSDQRNYWRLESSFSFSSTKEEFGKFLERK